MDTVLLLIVAAAAGAGLGYAIFSNRGKGQQERAHAKAEKELAEAETKAKDILLKAQDDSLKAKESAQEDVRDRRKQLEATESRLASREQNLDRKEKQLEERLGQLEKDREQAKTLKEEIAEVKERQVQNLEKVAKLTQAKAKDVLLKMLEKEFSEEFARKIHDLEEQAKEEGEQRAKKIIAASIQRYAADQSAELTVTTVQIPNEEIKGRIIGKEGRNIQSFEKATGVDIIVDDTPDTIVISGYNPVRRQIARITMEKLVSDGRINPSRIEEVVGKAEKEVNQIAKKAGEEAVYELKLSGLNPDLVKLLGTMKFRTSYGQNILKHSVEVSFIAQMLAGELGVDATKAKLVGLFHDIGKAVTHEVEGPHALIGRDICKKYGLPEDVCHAVGAHHEDLPIESTLDIICQVSDAISGARPGARRESYEQYVKRLQELENVANAFDGVEKTYAIQAGREIRILVKPQEIDDLSTVKLAKDIAKKIEQELTYPGQIKVNVIRETRATELAK